VKRKVLLQLVVPLLSLCVLFLLLTTDPVGSRQTQQLLEISVIFRQSDTATWSAVRQGMEQAAVDLNAELRFLTPAGEDVAAEQAELLEREAETGTDAILLIPFDRDALTESVHQITSGGTPVVTLETDMKDAGATACIGADNTALGQALGTAALNGAPRGTRVVLLDTAPAASAAGERLLAAESVLKEEGRRAWRCTPQEEETLSEALEWALNSLQPAAVIAFDAADLEQAAALLAAREDAPLLYGAGSTATVAAYLEQSTIVSIAAQNDFAAGYLAVGAAVRAAQGQGPFQIEPLEFVMVRQENMYNPENQKLLFPVTR
jgi:ribose transport system substrate-binding protein